MSHYWKRFIFLFFLIVCFSCPANGSCDEYEQCELVYPDDFVRCLVTEQGNSVGDCFGIGSTLHSCTCIGIGQTLQLPANGKDSFQCTEDATWETEFSELECVAKQCSPPPFADDSVILVPDQELYDNGIKVIFECDECCELNEEEISTICLNGKWTYYTEPSCSAKQCSRPLFADNSVILIPDQELYDNGTEVDFQCDKCCDLNEEEISTTCLYGNWTSHTEPNCSAKQCYPPLFVDDYVILIPDQELYDNGTEVDFQCDKCCDLNEEEISTTCLYGNWTSHTEPSCSAKQCYPPPFADDYVILIPDQELYDNGTEVVFQCDKCCDLNEEEISTTCLYGNWTSHTEPSCSAKQCYPPPFADDYVILIPDQELYDNGTEVDFQCDKCCDLNEEEISTTCLYGNWTSHTEPSCSAKQCYPPPFADDYVILIPDQELYDNGTEVVFQCDKCCDLNEEEISTTCLYGNWTSHTEPSCSAKQCYPPLFVDDYVILIPDQELYDNGTEVVFQCDKCCDLNEEEISTTCLYGNWTSHTEPSCSAKQCSPPPFADDLVILVPDQELYDNGSKVVFECDECCALNEEDISTICLHGNWTPYTEPSCSESPFVSCPGENISPYGVYLTFDDALAGTTANSTEICGHGSSKAEEPLATRECTESGWEDPVLTKCFTNEEAVDTIADIENTTVTEDNVEDVANTLAMATTYTDALTAKEVDSVALSLEAIVEINSSSIEVTDSVVGVVNNLMEVDTEVLGQAESTASVVTSIERQVSNAQQSPENLTAVQDNVGVEAVKCDPLIADGVTFLIVPSTGFPDDVTGNGNLEDGDLQLHNSQKEVNLEYSTSSIYVPKGVLERSIQNTTSKKNSKILLSFSIFKDSRLFQAKKTGDSQVMLQTQNDKVRREVIASQVIAAKIEGDNVRNLQGEDLIIARFIINPALEENETIYEQRCVYWKELGNSNEGQWQSDGCTTTPDNDQIMCTCNHLTNFAVLVGIGATQKVLDVITITGSCLSVAGLSVCVLTIILIKDLREKQSAQIHLNLCVSLIAFYVTFLSSDLAAKDERHCKNISSAIHYFCLTTMGWMSVEGVNMYFLFVKFKRDDLPFFVPISAALVYGLSLIPVTSVAVIEDPKTYADADVCFLQKGKSLYFGFLLEVLIIVVFNIFIFMLLLRNVVFRPMLSTTTKLEKKKEMFARMQLFVLFWTLLGLSWIFGFLAVIPDRKTIIFEIMFCIFISIQGIVLLIFICLKNPEVRKRFSKAISTGDGSEKTTKSKLARGSSTKESDTAGFDTHNKTRLELSMLYERQMNTSIKKSHTINKHDNVAFSLNEQFNRPE